MSKRVEILNKFKEKILTIVDFENRVYKKITMPDLLKEYPAANVILGDVTYTQLTGHHITTEPAGLEISVIVWKKVGKDVDDSGALTDSLDDLVKKVVDTILSECCLGLNYVKIVELTSIIPVVDWKNNIGAMEIIFRVIYDFEKGNF